MKLPLKYLTYGQNIKETLIEFDIYKPLDDELIEQLIQHKYVADCLFKEYLEFPLEDIKSRNDIDNMRVRSIKLHNTCLDKLNITPQMRSKLDILQAQEEDPFFKLAELMA